MGRVSLDRDNGSAIDQHSYQSDARLRAGGFGRERDQEQGFGATRHRHRDRHIGHVGPSVRGRQHEYVVG